MTRQEILDILIQNIKDILFEIEQNSITENMSMKDLGANSIDRMTIIVQSLSDLRLKIQMTELKGVSNIGELVDFLYKKTHETVQKF